MNKKCSIIISTHNRSDKLRDALESLASQTVSRESYEIIVGDSYSSDKGASSLTVINEIREKYPSLDLLYFYEPVIGGWTLTRTKAINFASSPIIIIGDDDFLATETFIEGALEAFNEPSVGIVEGRMLPKYLSPPPKWVDALWESDEEGRYLTDFTLLDLGEHFLEIPWRFAMGSNMAFRKKIFDESPGFGPDGFGGGYVKYNGLGEHLFSQFVASSNYKIVYSPKMLAYHQIEAYRFQKAYFSARYFYYGVTDSFELTRICKGRSNVINILKRLGGYLAHALFDASASKHPFRLQKVMYIRGFIFHQIQLRRDPELLQYCLQNSWKSFDFSKLKPSEVKATLW